MVCEMSTFSVIIIIIIIKKTRGWALQWSLALKKTLQGTHPPPQAPSKIVSIGSGSCSVKELWENYSSPSKIILIALHTVAVAAPSVLVAVKTEPS